MACKLLWLLPDVFRVATPAPNSHFFSSGPLMQQVSELPNVAPGMEIYLKYS